MADALILPAFRFEVKLLRSPDIIAGSQRLPGADDGYSPAQGRTLLGTGAFQECTGLEIEMDIQEYQEGGRNNGTIRRVGRAKYQPLLLKRGMFYQRDGDGQASPELWHWLQRIINGERPVPRHDGIVYVMSADQSVRATWMFDRGLPAKIRGPELNARTGEIAIEELTIAHEGLRLLPAEVAA
ncbi:MAG TPA: phage tail protein [Accumulibacter sp.]|uniref:phage tail protein n=1 Tax=Accumulibacter sp. TaxID=2053492 RepID=UPI000EEA65E3|nr:phage tail protein [Accumulibacter sp.]HCZ15246.1 phage tail protein [Accumulibacter sp.]HRD93733.1 phage tail protein [Accumulibacter sp.]HRF74337.1 phage tail protein [Accumulibacter sp.]